jgi:DNA polymerase-3 subunit gamma/tau
MEQDWATLLPKLGLTGLTQTVANHCSLVKIKGEQLHLAIESSQAALLNPKLIQRIEAAVQTYFAKPLVVIITVANESVASPARNQLLNKEKRYQQAKQAIMEDNNVQSLLKTFDGHIQQFDSIQSITPLTTKEV